MRPNHLVQKRSEETHTRILTTALSLFAHAGYDATGVAEICNAAQVSKGAFYHHFSTKQDVFLELLNIWLAKIDQEIAIIRQETDNVAAALERMSGTLSKVFEDASGHLPMFLEFWVQASHDPAIWHTIIEPYRRYQEYFKLMIQQGVADGSLRPVDPDTAGHLLVSLAVGSLLQGVIEPSPETWKNITQQGLYMLIESWRNSP